MTYEEKKSLKLLVKGLIGLTLHDFFLWKAHKSYNDCPTYHAIKGKNPSVFLYECHCNPWIYRKMYRYLIYPLGSRLFGWYDQEAVMRRIEKDYEN